MEIQIGDRRVTAIGLSQVSVYADVLEGVPDLRVNAIYVNAALERARRTYHLEPMLITPTQRPISRDGTKFALPKVCCAARFRSEKPAHDLAAVRSEACVVWFQDEFAFPLDAEVANAMRLLDWLEFANDDFM